MNPQSSKDRSILTRTCFVISPIGVEGSEQRQHADDVYDFIVKPAMDECGVSALRSDQILHPGRISDQMFRSLLQADFCLAIVTFDNPNVFYELAIAHAASRPVVLLNQKGHVLPFDIKDVRCVEYEYLLRPMAKGDYARLVVDQIRSLEASAWQAPDLLGTYGLPVGEKLSGVTTFLARSNEYESSGGWEETLGHARFIFDTAGLSLSHWRNIKGFSERLTALGREGCRVRILLMDPQHPLLQCCFNPAIPEMIPAQVVSELTVMLKFFGEIAAASPNVSVRVMRKAISSFDLTCTDREALARLYLFSERPKDTPLWGCRQGSRLYEVLSQEFNALWEANAA